ncbi:MAG: HEAT repeat domain-containing protein [Victivallaceae bacterium]
MNKDKIYLQTLKDQLMFSDGSVFDELPPDIAINILCEFTKNRASELRMRAVERLRFHKGRQVLFCLKHLLEQERNPLVVTAALESVESIKSPIFIEILKRKLRDSAPLVRGYAAITMSSISPKLARESITKVLIKERSSWVRCAFYISLYKIGVPNTLFTVFSFFKSKQYRVRCLVANSFSSMPKQDDINIIRNVLRKQLRKESSNAVISSIKKTLQTI